CAKSKMIEIGRLSTMWSDLECTQLAIEDYRQCPRLQQTPTRSPTTDKPASSSSSSVSGVSLRYQLAVSISIPTSFLLACTVAILCLGSVLAAPQTSCIMCNKEDLRPRVPPYSDSYTEWTFDHQVSQQSAMESLQKFNESHAQNNACNSIKCPPNVMKYCLGTQFINDHCWCEMQHREEGLPYVPHTCFLDEKVHTPSVGSCFVFAEVKECCCAGTWVKKWRHISGSSRSQHIPKILIPLLSALSLLRWTSRRWIF
ncbi:hypothetical protein KR059_012229, partial [Drosophila kikkawai]